MPQQSTCSTSALEAQSQNREHKYVEQAKKRQKYMSHKHEAQNTCRKGTKHRAHAAHVAEAQHKAHGTQTQSTEQI